jgi:hypothetical protein
MNLELTFDFLPLFGGLLVLLNYYAPAFKEWYAGLSAEKKQTANAGIIGVVGLVAVGLSALDVVEIYGGNTWQSWVFPPLVDWVIALLANAGVYKATNHIFK